MKHLLLALAIAVTLGCGATDARPLSRNDNAASIGEAWPIGGLILTPQRVIEDSRCPVDADCFWPGRVVLRTLATRGPERQTVDLISGEPTSILGGLLTLETVTPEAMLEMEIRARSYRFTFSFAEE